MSDPNQTVEEMRAELDLLRRQSLAARFCDNIFNCPPMPEEVERMRTMLGEHLYGRPAHTGADALAELAGMMESEKL